MKRKIEKLLSEAEDKLLFAEKEINRPQEDAMELSVCICVKDAIRDYLKAFLLSNNITPSELSSISDLLKQCAEVSDHFNEIDLTCVYCKKATPLVQADIYCLTEDKTRNCFAAAKKVAAMVGRGQVAV